MTERNWRVVDLVAHPELGHYTVVVEIFRRSEELPPDCQPFELGRCDTMETPSAYHGVEYLSRAERGIIRRGITASGADRKIRAA